MKGDIAPEVAQALLHLFVTPTSKFLGLLAVGSKMLPTMPRSNLCVKRFLQDVTGCMKHRASGVGLVCAHLWFEILQNISQKKEHPQNSQTTNFMQEFLPVFRFQDPPPKYLHTREVVCDKSGI